MAAPKESVQQSSSSEDDEEIEKLREAAWSFGGTNGNLKAVSSECKDKLSRRVNVSEHEHDGNELQTTPEFRAYVAKKLGSMLDCYISENSRTESQTTEKQQFASREDEDDGEVFRLFSTSIPGVLSQPPLARRRPVPSSSSESDNEMEMRLREAAVPLTHFLPSPPTAVVTDNQTMKRRTKKTKKNMEESKSLEEGSKDKAEDMRRTDTQRGQADPRGVCDCSEGAVGGQEASGGSTSPQEDVPVKRRRKKKRKRVTSEVQ